MVGMKEVARHAGVSHGTVSHALNHPERVSAETLRRVQQAVDELGYVRNEAARQLRDGRSTTLGLILIDNWNEFFNELTEGFEEAVADAGLNVIVANSALDKAKESAHLDAFEQRRLAGILIIPQGPQTVDRLVQIRHRGTPTVLVDQNADGFDIHSVAVDDIAGGMAAGRHLMEIGRRRVLFIGNRTTSHANDRLTGLRKGASGAESIDDIDADHLDFPNGLAVGQHLAALDPASRPDAVFCANDMLALGVIQAMYSRGVRVPEDIAVIGYDDVGLPSQVGMPLTSVRQPARLLGQTGGRILLQDIAGESRIPAEHVMYTPELFVRTSTIGSAYRGAHPAPARASALRGA